MKLSRSPVSAPRPTCLQNGRSLAQRKGTGPVCLSNMPETRRRVYPRCWYSQTVLRVIDLFSGPGGFTSGFTAAGWETALAVESDPAAAATWTANHKGPIAVDDISEVDDFGSADAIVGGLPCQGFSRLRRREERAGDERNSLWSEFLRAVEAVRPAVFAVENVPAFLNSPECGSLAQAADRLGYHLTFQIINAADYGVPQRRKRVFMFGSAGRPVGPLYPTHWPSEPGRRFSGMEYPTWRTVRQALRGIPLQAGRLPARTRVPLPGPYNTLDIHRDNPRGEPWVKMFAAVPPGGDFRDVPDHLRVPAWANKKQFIRTLGRLEWDKPSYTVIGRFREATTGYSLHPSEDRAITPWEAARLQTFPDSYLWFGSIESIARQIGNAVPPLLAERIAEHLTDHIRKEPL